MIFGGMAGIHLFPYYQTREEYEQKTGKPCPQYTDKLPLKAWEDPDADKDTSTTFIFYDVIALSASGSGQCKVNREGKPYLEKFAIRRTEASRVNIPPKGGDLDIIGSHNPVPGEVPMPCRQLKATETLELTLFGGVKLVDHMSESAKGESDNLSKSGNSGNQPTNIDVLQRLGSVESQLKSVAGVLQELVPLKGVDKDVLTLAASLNKVATSVDALMELVTAKPK